ncbi:MAG: hypothetical protein ABI277_12425 [Burkholderiaceae bacterium]
MPGMKAASLILAGGESLLDDDWRMLVTEFAARDVEIRPVSTAESRTDALQPARSAKNLSHIAL